MSYLKNFVVKAYKDKSLEELLQAPVSALKGLSAGDEEKLIKALGIRTIEDLANHWSVRRAQAIVGGTETDSLSARVATESADEALEADKWGDAMDTVLGGDSDSITLKGAWINLQMYSYYCVGLPTDITALKVTLQTDSLTLLGDTVTDSMITNYTTLKDNSNFFLNEVYDKIVNLGHALKNFAEDGNGNEDSLFSLILSLIDGDDNDKSDALEFLVDRIEQSAANAKQAEAVLGKISEYTTKLEEGRKGLATLKDLVNKNDDLNQDKIDKLEGDATVKGSLNNLRKKLGDANDELTHDIHVVEGAGGTAAAGVVCMWIPPVGAAMLIGGAVVAGIWTKDILNDLDEIDKYEAEIEAADRKLKTAKKTNQILDIAEEGISQTLEYTLTAKRSITKLKEGWSNIADDLTVVKNKLGKTIRTKDDEATLQSDRMVKRYVTDSMKQWDILYPSIKILMTNAYINYEGQRDFSELKEKIIASQSEE